MINVILALAYFALVGAAVHKLVGKDGNLLHNTFIGAAGSGLGAFLEWITGMYNTTIIGVIVTCVACALVVELVIRHIKYRRGWLPHEDRIADYEDVEVE